MTNSAELKTNKIYLENTRYMYGDVEQHSKENLRHDALLAHDLQERIDKVLAMRPEKMTGTHHASISEHGKEGRNDRLAEIQTILKATP